MPLKNQALTVQYVAWNTATNQGETGDVGNHTLTAVGDGTLFSPLGAPAEVNAVLLPGVYKLAMGASEMNHDCITLGGTSTTPNVVIIPLTMMTDGGNLDAAVSDVPASVLKLDWTGITGEASRSVLNALRFLRNKWTISGTTLTVTKEDDAAAAWTGAVGTTTGADPITSIDPN